MGFGRNVQTFWKRKASNPEQQEPRNLLLEQLNIVAALVCLK